MEEEEAKLSQLQQLCNEGRIDDLAAYLSSDDDDLRETLAHVSKRDAPAIKPNSQQRTRSYDSDSSDEAPPSRKLHTAIRSVQRESDSDDESPLAAMVQAIAGSGGFRSEAEKAESESQRRAKGSPEH